MKQRRGGIYLLTLAGALILVAIVLGLSHLLLQFRRFSRSDSRAELAQFHAQMGIRHALFFTAQSPDWRSLLPNGEWLRDICVDQARYSVSGVAPGGLGGGSEQRITLTATATVAGVSRTLKVQARQAPSLLLANAVTTGGTLSIANHARITGPISSNTEISKNGADTWVWGSARSPGTITETAGISGPVLPGSPAQLFPSASEIITYYSSRGLALPYIPVLENTLIGAGINPLGILNPDGVFVINCANQKIVIRNIRILGTLVLLNPKSDSTVEGAINWSPARPDYPALVVSGGGIALSSSANLTEIQRLRDFSLPGEPGFLTLNDTYPNRIQGAIYVNGNLTLGNLGNVNGSIIATGAVYLKDSCILTLDPGLAADNPPNAINEYWLAPIRGSWQEP